MKGFKRCVLFSLVYYPEEIIQATGEDQKAGLGVSGVRNILNLYLSVLDNHTKF